MSKRAYIRDRTYSCKEQSLIMRRTYERTQSQTRHFFIVSCWKTSNLYRTRRQPYRRGRRTKISETWITIFDKCNDVDVLRFYYFYSGLTRLYFMWRQNNSYVQSWASKSLLDSKRSQVCFTMMWFFSVFSVNTFSKAFIMKITRSNYC